MPNQLDDGPRPSLNHHPTPRNALFVGPSVGPSRFLPHLTRTHTNLMCERRLEDDNDNNNEEEEDNNNNEGDDDDNDNNDKCLVHYISISETSEL